MAHSTRQFLNQSVDVCRYGWKGWWHLADMLRFELFVFEDLGLPCAGHPGIVLERWCLSIYAECMWSPCSYSSLSCKERHDSEKIKLVRARERGWKGFEMLMHSTKVGCQQSCHMSLPDLSASPWFLSCQLCGVCCSKIFCKTNELGTLVTQNIHGLAMNWIALTWVRPSQLVCTCALHSYIVWGCSRWDQHGTLMRRNGCGMVVASRLFECLFLFWYFWRWTFLS